MTKVTRMRQLILKLLEKKFLFFFIWAALFKKNSAYYNCEGEMVSLRKKKDHVCLDGMLFPETFPGYGWQKVNLLFPWRVGYSGR